MARKLFELVNKTRSASPSNPPSDKADAAPEQPKSDPRAKERKLFNGLLRTTRLPIENWDSDKKKP